MINIEQKVECKINSYGQKGLFARYDIAIGDVIAEGVSDPAPHSLPGWPAMKYEEALLLPTEQRKLYLSHGVSIDFIGGMVGPLYARDVENIENYVNHSCDPNIWFGDTNRKEGDFYEVRRAIKAGMYFELIT